MKIIVVTFLIIGLLGSTTSINADYDNVGENWMNGKGKIKNIIVMVPDGCSQAVQTLARWYKGDSLVLDEYISGMMSTYMANSVITGSAASATAFATGHKTTARFLSVGPTENTPWRSITYKPFLTSFTPTATDLDPLATVLEGAQLKGKATGLVATSRITHATPAAYACHVKDRGYDNEIMEHMVYHDVDVVFGGGLRHLIPDTETYTTSYNPIPRDGRRSDGENLYDVLMNRGYQFVDNKDDMMDLESGKVWGLFADSHMEADMDRSEFAEHQPSIAEMTDKAIELLSQNKDGFFLMVEGSQIDWAGHQNDPVYMVIDFLAFDDAVEVAIDYAKSNKNTLVLIFPDHDTGALAIGNMQTSNTYTTQSIQDLIDPLLGMTITSTGIARYIEADDVITPGEIEALIETYWNLDVDPAHAQEIFDLYDDPSTPEDYDGMYLNNAIGEVISREHTIIGWTTHGHNGIDVPIWSYGPNRPIGFFDNTDMAKIVAENFGFDLDKVDEKLFVTVTDEFNPVKWNVDTSDPDNPVLELKGDDGWAYLPIGTDLMTYDDEDYELEGIVVQPGNGHIYIPEQVVDILD